MEEKYLYVIYCHTCKTHDDESGYHIVCPNGDETKPIKCPHGHHINQQCTIVIENSIKKEDLYSQIRQKKFLDNSRCENCIHRGEKKLNYLCNCNHKKTHPNKYDKTEIAWCGHDTNFLIKLLDKYLILTNWRKVKL